MNLFKRSIGLRMVCELRILRFVRVLIAVVLAIASLDLKSNVHPASGRDVPARWIAEFTNRRAHDACGNRRELCVQRMGKWCLR